MPRHRRLLAALALVFAAAGLSSCAGTVSMQPAADANDPLCATVMVGLPSNVSGEQRRWTDAQSTGAWGSPAAVLLTCGVTPPGPTTATCVTIDGVDWIVDEADAPKYRVTTYGRTPAVELYIDNETVSSNSALQAISPLVAALPKDAECTARDSLPE